MQRYIKKLDILLSEFFRTWTENETVRYEGAIPLTGYANLEGLGVDYDAKREQMSFNFQVQRTDKPIEHLTIPTSLADAKAIEPRFLPKGQHTAMVRTFPEKWSGISAVPDITENVTEGSMEWETTDIPDPGLALIVIITSVEQTFDHLQYKEPLLSFYRDGQRFHLYVEEQSVPATETLGVVWPQGDNPKTTEPVGQMPEAPEMPKSPGHKVEHLGPITPKRPGGFGGWDVRIHTDISPLYNTMRNGEETYGGYIPLFGYHMADYNASYDEETGRIVFGFEAWRTPDPLRKVPQLVDNFSTDMQAAIVAIQTQHAGIPAMVVGSVPDISDGLSEGDAEFAPSNHLAAAGNLRPQQLNFIVSKGEFQFEDYSTFKKGSQKPILHFVRDGFKYFVYAELQDRTLTNDVYTHEFRIPLDELDDAGITLGGHSLPGGFSDTLVPGENITARISSNRRKLVVTLKLRRHGDFEVIKKHVASDSIKQVSRYSAEAMDHGEEGGYALTLGHDDEAHFIEATGVFFHLDDYDGGKLEDAKNTGHDDAVPVCIVGDKVVFASYDVD